MNKEVVGVLALQGDFDKHRRSFLQLGAEVHEIKTSAELMAVGRLVIPGGESTTLTRLITPEMRSALIDFAISKPVWGTCAGMIMLGRPIGDPRVQPLELMDIRVDRNGYGRQVHSFEALVRVDIEIGQPEQPLRAIFIRAPRLIELGSSVKPVAWLGEHPVCVRQGRLLASEFHPELTDDLRIQRYFLSL